MLAHVINKFPIQIVKMSQAGEVSVESAPYRDLDTCPLPTTPSGPECPLATNPPSSRPETIREESEETGKEAETPEMAEGRAEEMREDDEKKGDSQEGTRRRKLGVTFRVEGEVRLRRHPPSRSRTMSNRPPQRSVDLRRQSLCNLRKGETGEMGSRSFRRALRRDSVYEIHPGWESIRKLSKVIG